MAHLLPELIARRQPSRLVAASAAAAATGIAGLAVVPEEPATGLALIGLAWVPAFVAFRARPEPRIEAPVPELVDRETGLGTAALLDEILRREIARSARYGAPLSLAVFEIEVTGFRPSAPGELPPSPAPFVARALVNFARESDSVFRLDRRRFVAVLAECDERGGAALVSRVLAQISSSPYARNGDGSGIYVRALGAAVSWRNDWTSPAHFIAAGLEALCICEQEKAAEEAWFAGSAPLLPAGHRDIPG